MTREDEPEESICYFPQYLRVCIVTAMIGCYGSISQKKLEPRWEIIDELVKRSDYTIFQEEHR